MACAALARRTPQGVEAEMRDVLQPMVVIVEIERAIGERITPRWRDRGATRGSEGTLHHALLQQ